jgi:TolB-like protein
MLKLLRLFLLLLTYFSFLTINADEVILKNAKVLENVKVKISVDKVTVQYKDSKIESYPKSQVKSIRLRPIIISNPVTETDKIANEQEKIRVSESLQNLAGVEIPADQKQKIAVLNFKTSKNIPKEEADLIVETITTNLVKTNLFVIIDPITVTKIMNEQGGPGCADNPANCKVSANSIAKTLNASKVITGTINKIQNGYYINGNVIDINSNNIDFAETANAKSFDKIPDATENFSKKVAGGITSVSNTSINLSGDDSKGFFSNWFSSKNKPEEQIQVKSVKSSPRLPFVWRSALIPGWGQFADGRKVKAFAIFGLFAGAVAFEANAISKYNAAKDNYSDITMPYLVNTYLTNSNQAGIGFALNYLNSQSAKEQLDTRAATIGVGAGLIAFVYLYGIFDSYYFANSKQASLSEQEKGFRLSVNAIPVRSIQGQNETQYSVSIQGRF